MFTIHDSSLHRREILKIGALSLGGLTLADLLAAQAQGAEQSLTTGKSVIFLFQHGGPPQYETFDPKMNAPDGIRSVYGATNTTVPGMEFGGSMTRLAKHAHRLAIVRSYQTSKGNHDIKPIVSPASLNANIGSLYSRIVGTTRSDGMPTNAAIFPNAVDPKAPKAFNKFGKFASTGTLGSSYAPFSPGADGQLQKNLQLNMKKSDLEQRRQLLSQLDQLKRKLDSQGSIQSIDQFQQQAFDVIMGGVADAFDLSKEDPRVIDKYDTSGFVASHGWKKVNNGKSGYYNAHASSLGKLLLLARRLCEAGCGFVTISTSFVWDFHADKNNLGPKDGMQAVGAPFDHAVAAFIEDIEARGLSDKIMLVATGEMGRTPKINKRGGRDHWGRLTPLMIYGGGVQGGQIIGRSNRDGGEPATTPITSDNLIATIMHSLLNVGEVRVTNGVPSDVLRVITENKPIPELS